MRSEVQGVSIKKKAEGEEDAEEMATKEAEGGREEEGGELTCTLSPPVR